VGKKSKRPVIRINSQPHSNPKKEAIYWTRLFYKEYKPTHKSCQGKFSRKCHNYQKIFDFPSLETYLGQAAVINFLK
jgi:hypothetical protein